MTTTRLELMDVKEAAEYVRKSPRWIRQQLRDGNLPGVKMGRDWLIHVDRLNAMLSPTDRDVLRGPATPQRLGDDTPGSAPSLRGDVEPGVDRQNNQGGK